MQLDPHPPSSLNPHAHPFFPTRHSLPTHQHSTPPQLTLLSTNCRSVVNKCTELTIVAEEWQPDIICLTETWLDPNIAPNITRYDTFRRDRPPAENKSGTSARGYGGVAILVRQNKFKSVAMRPDLARDGCEAVWVQLQPYPAAAEPILLCCSYRPPSAKPTDIARYCQTLEDVLITLRLSSSHVILTGDFNSKHTSWCSTDSTNTAGAELYRTLSPFGLHQLVNTCTYTSPSGVQACLDLVFSNRANLSSCVETDCPLGASDHAIVYCQFDIPLPQFPREITSQAQEPNPMSFDLRHVTPAVWEAVNADLDSVPWNSLISSDVDSALSNLHSVLQTVLSKYVPLHSSRKPNRTPSTPGSTRKYHPWVSTELRKAIKLKRDLFSLSKKFPTGYNLSAYKAQRNQVRHLSRWCHRQYIRSIKTTLTSGSTSLHHFVRSQRSHKVKPGIPDIASPDGLLVSDSFQKATILNKQFTSVAVPDDPRLVIPPLQYDTRLTRQFTRVHITTADVRKAISNLKSGKAPGRDGITNNMIKKLAPAISFPLSRLFNLSFTTGKFPTDWKLAKIVPIYKCKGSKSQASNYRPISQLSCISKLCERLFFNQLYNHISPALDPAQSGFRRGDSTALQLTKLIQNIADHRHMGRKVAMCFFDLEKAFDTVWHRALLAKLSKVFGVCDSALEWITDYLSNRTQVVFVGGTLSDASSVLSGVPQ